MKKLPTLPKGTKIHFIYRSNDYVNLVEMKNGKITFFLWDETSQFPNHVLSFPREYLTTIIESK